MSLEENFEKELIENIKKAEKDFNCPQKKLLLTIEKFGALKTSKEILRKRKLSEGFYKLKEAKALELTMESTIVLEKYGSLFTDEEVNSCHEILCENGYY